MVFMYKSKSILYKYKIRSKKHNDELAIHYLCI